MCSSPKRNFSIFPSFTRQNKNLKGQLIISSISSGPHTAQSAPPPVAPVPAATTKSHLHKLSAAAAPPAAFYVPRQFRSRRYCTQWRPATTFNFILNCRLSLIHIASTHGIPDTFSNGSPVSKAFHDPSVCCPCQLQPTMVALSEFTEQPPTSAAHFPQSSEQPMVNIGPDSADPWPDSASLEVTEGGLQVNH